MEQELFNWLLGGFSLLVGVILRTLWEEIKALKKADTAFAEKLSSIEVLVAGNYVTRDELNRNVMLLSTKLDSIHTKLDEKADKR